jgi:glycine betaine catabolism A
MTANGGATTWRDARSEPNYHLSSSTPPGRIYSDPAILDQELDQFFYRTWLCVGREDQIPGKGDFFTRRIGRESILFTRDGAGKVHGFYNVCRHRGTPVVSEAEGKGAHSFVCPYHSWTYGVDGRLTGAPHTKGLEGFDRANYGLWPVRVDTWGGFLWANLEPEGRSLREELGAFFGKFGRFPLADLKLGARKVYEVEANWKLIVENYSECYHCAPIHPQLNRLTPYLSGENDAYFLEKGGRSNFSGGYMEFAKDYTSMTRDGYTKRPLIPGMTADDRKRVYYYVVFPNLLFSLHPDYLMIHRNWPVAPSHSIEENEFYFTAEAMARPDFDPSDAVDFWDETNQQDWKVCELAQVGTASRAWRGGRYSEQETLVCDFDRFVTEELDRGAKK